MSLDCPRGFDLLLSAKVPRELVESGGRVCLDCLEGSGIRLGKLASRVLDCPSVKSLPPYGRVGLRPALRAGASLSSPTRDPAASAARCDGAHSPTGDQP